MDWLQIKWKKYLILVAYKGRYFLRGFYISSAIGIFTRWRCYNNSGIDDFQVNTAYTKVE